MNEDGLKTRRWTWQQGWMCLVAYSFLVSALATIVHGQHLPWLLEVVLIKPLILLTILLTILLIGTRRLGLRIESWWSFLVNLLPVSALVCLIFLWTNIWNDGGATIPLTLRDAGLFILTLGIWPLTIGPDVVLRVTILAFVIGSGFFIWKKTGDKRQAITTALLCWIPSAILLLIQTWVAMTLSVINGWSWPRTAEDAARLFGRAVTTSAWASFQADRFFASLGSQRETLAHLLSAAVIFIWLVIVMLILHSPPPRGGVRGGGLWRGGEYAFGLLLVGLFLGGRAFSVRWETFDVISFILLLIILGSWSIWRWLKTTNSEGLDEMRMMVVWISLVGAVLLGWPILLIMIGLFLMEILTHDSFFPWSGSLGYRLVCCIGSSSLIVALGQIYMARNPVLPTSLLLWTLAWGVLMACVAFIQQHVWNPVQRTGLFLTLGVGLSLFALIPRQSVMLALAAPTLLILIGLHLNQQRWQRFAIPLVILYAVAGTLLVSFFS